MQFLSSLPGILLIILGFGVLIFVHELGHFLAAKWAGIRTEVFAVGMGPVMISWRKGIGLAVGSTEKKMMRRAGRRSTELSESDLERLGIGETEYSLRWLPIGGFVKMLGQDDLNPNAVSADARSYNRCTIGKRMVVVSAGVIMNVLLALALFVLSFMVGVKFEAPVIGDVSATLPAGVTEADNAAALQVTTPGLKPGDRVLSINGKRARTFADIQIRTAMSRPGDALRLEVERQGVGEPLLFTLQPAFDDGLLSIGVYPGRSTTLLGGAERDEVNEYLADAGLGAQGVTAGMKLLRVDGQSFSTYGELARHVDASEGRPLETVWSSVSDLGLAVGDPVTAQVTVDPTYERMFQRSDGAAEPVFDEGLLGLCPLTEITRILEGSPNEGIVQPGDLIVRVGSIDYPRWSQLRAELRRHAGQRVELVVRRDGEDHAVTARVSRAGRLEIAIGSAESSPVTTGPVMRVFDPRGDTASAAAGTPTPAARLDLLPGTRIDAVNRTPISSWPSLRAALREGTAEALAAGGGATVELAVTHPTPQRETETVVVELTEAQVAALHALGWRTDLDGALFEPIYTVLGAGGNPIEAVRMGFAETHKLVMMTYLTIDRLFRGSVGVEQIRGPVGIIDLGAKILPKGFMYFMFFLGMISVNLAVINFLPLPIVDGGLFLFLIYERIKGRPPSPAFQNAATLVGLFLIGTIFVVTFYNDLARLLS